MSIEKPAKGPVYQMSNKPKKLKRRATIHTIHGLVGSSSALNPPIRIEDLVNLNNTENYCLNLNKSMKTSNLTTMGDSTGDHNGSITTNSNFYKSYNNLCSTTADYLLDDQLNPTIIRRDKPSLSKRACSEDVTQFIKRTVSVCYDEVHGVNNEFYLTNNYLSLPKSNNGKHSTTDTKLDKSCNEEEFNQQTENEEQNCFEINKYNNATVIKVNSSPPSNSDSNSKSSSKSNLPFAKVNPISESSDISSSSGQHDEQNNQLKSDIQVTSDNKNIVRVLGKESSSNDLKTTTNSASSKMDLKAIQNQQSQSKQLGIVLPSDLLNNKRSPAATANQLENDDLKIDRNEQADYLNLSRRKQDVLSSSTPKPETESKETAAAALKPEILKRKKSLKQAKCEYYEL